MSYAYVSLAQVPVSDVSGGDSVHSDFIRNVDAQTSDYPGRQRYDTMNVI